MKVFFTFCLFFVFAVVRSHGRTQEFNASSSFKKIWPKLWPSPLPSPTSYEYYFVQQWPASICSSNGCPSSTCSTISCPPKSCLANPCRAVPCPLVLPYFTVHGLWFQSNGNPYCCGLRTFNLIHLSEYTKARLEMFWPDLVGLLQNEGFWAHEYNKHASCLPQYQNNPDHFFSRTLELAHTFNATDMLRQAGIHPGRLYRIRQIRSAFYKTHRVNLILHCNLNSQNGVQLSEIRLCFDINLALKNCSGYDLCLGIGKNGLISFPPVFHSRSSEVLEYGP